MDKNMNYDQFVYWLQGFVETNGGNLPTHLQWEMIKDHLKLCFTKVTPHYGGYKTDDYKPIWARMIGPEFDPNSWTGNWLEKYTSLSKGYAPNGPKGGGGAC